MLHLGDNKARNKVNVLKKVKVDGKWKLCPAIVEPGGKLKDRVQVNGRAEVHNEGVYYIEWREDGQRRRQSVPVITSSNLAVSNHWNWMPEGPGFMRIENLLLPNPLRQP